MKNSLNQGIDNNCEYHNLLQNNNQQNLISTNSQVLTDLQKISVCVDKESSPIPSQKKVTGSATTGVICTMHEIEMRDKILVSNIMNVYLDSENRTILSCLKKPMTIQEIVTICKTPISSTYRRISFLLEKGYLRIAGYKKELGKKSKSTKFEKTIQNITIHIDESTVSVILNVSEDIIKEGKFRLVMKE